MEKKEVGLIKKAIGSRAVELITDPLSPIWRTDPKTFLRLFPNSTRALLIIRSGHSKSEIIPQVSNQIKRLALLHPNVFRKAETNRRGRVPMDLLKQLAALRLLDTLRFGKTRLLIEKHQSLEDPYPYPPNDDVLYVARKSARKYLKVVHSDARKLRRWSDEVLSCFS
jgi:hypothetical protein